MADNLGNITFNQNKFYAGGWSSWQNITSVYAGYTTSGGVVNKQYNFVDKITLPSFTNEKYVGPYTITVKASILKGSTSSTGTSGTAKIWLYSSDPTSAGATTDPPAGHIGYGELAYSGLTNNHPNPLFEIKVETDNDLSSGGTYYLWIDTTSWTTWQYDKKISATLSGTVATFKVAYNGNGGTGVPQDQTKTYGTDLTLSSTKPTKANTNPAGYKVTFDPNGGSCNTTELTATRTTSYTFASWNTAANGTGATYAAGATYSTNAAITLYAQYSSSTATSAIALPVATRTGYTFKGWSTSSSATSGTTGSYTPSGATTLYATWQINTYTLTLDSSGTGIASFTGGGTFNYGSLAETTATASTGYHLTKYTGTQHDGTSGGEWAIAGNVTTDTDNWTMNADRTIKVWASPNTYTVTYNANGATSGSMSNSIATYNAGFRTKQNAFVRPGYKMSGWNEKADGSGTWWYLDRPGTYESGQDWNWNYTKNITLYAQWEPNGTVRIWNGSKWVLALPFIYTGATKGWIQAIPYTYVNDTEKWKLCGG